MARLLSIEWLKISKYTTFWVLSGMFMVLLLLWNWGISSGLMKLGGGDINILSVNYTFPAVWANVAYWTKFFSGLIAIIIIILTTNEFQYRTNRQNVIDGWERQQFYHAKWLIVLAFGIIVTAYTFLQGLFFALAHGAHLADAAENTVKIFHTFILTLNYFGFALTLSLFLKRSGMAIIIFLVYAYAIELMLCQFLNWKIDAHPGYFLPMQCSAELLSFPMTDMLKKMTKKPGPSDSLLIAVSVVWIAIYYIVGQFKMLKSNW